MSPAPAQDWQDQVRSLRQRGVITAAVQDLALVLVADLCGRVRPACWHEPVASWDWKAGVDLVWQRPGQHEECGVRQVSCQVGPERTQALGNLITAGGHECRVIWNGLSIEDHLARLYAWLWPGSMKEA